METGNNYSFFENRDCRYYPCHKGLDEINCLFCYCPMYFLEHCPGKHTIIENDGKKIKSCLECDFPHKRENYETIMKILKNAL